MSKEFRFSGYSDDNFGEDRDPWDNCADGRPIRWVVKSGDESVMVVGHYCEPDRVSGWMVGIARFDEDDDKHIPNWAMRFEQNTDHRTYSPVLVMEVPDDATLTCLEPEERDDG